MEYANKLVTELPLTDLWTSEKMLDALRIRHLSEEDIQNLIQGGTVSFAVATIGETLNWIDPAKIQEFWESEVKFRVALPDEEIFLDYFPDNYCYIASEWAPFKSGCLILLEKCS